MKKELIFVITFLCSAFLQAQSTFRNLNFESAGIVPLGGGSPSYLVVSSNALPAWNIYIDESIVNVAIYDTVSIGSPEVSIHDSASSFPPLAGRYSVIIQGAMDINANVVTTAIGQTGRVPADAASLFFYAANYQHLQVTFAGNLIPLIQIGAAANYSILGGNFAAYAGQTGELRFSGTTVFPLLTLDNIQFSTVAVPEPTAGSLFALGGFAFVFWRWRKPTRT